MSGGEAREGNSSVLRASLAVPVFSSPGNMWVHRTHGGGRVHPPLGKCGGVALSEWETKALKLLGCLFLNAVPKLWFSTDYAL